MRVVLFLLFPVASVLADALGGRGSEEPDCGSEGAGAPSLLQVAREAMHQVAGREGTRSLSGSYELVESMAAKVAGHNYTLTETENQALSIIKTFIRDMEATLDTQHEEDQTEMNISVGAIQDCMATVNGKLQTVNGFKTTMETNRGSHASCRTSEVSKKAIAMAACKAFEDHRILADAQPPACLQELTAGNIASTDAEKKQKMKDCLKETSEWVNPLYTKSSACDGETDDWKAATQQCVAKQLTYETSFCTYELELENACDDQVACRNRDIDVYNSAKAGVEISEAARKADLKTGKRLLCFFDVFEAENANKSSIFTTCKDLVVDASAYTIDYFAIPVIMECTKEVHKPCEGSWTDEYDKHSWNSQAIVDACTPCIAPPPAADCEMLPPQHFDGVTSIVLPESCHATGNEARSMLVWIKNGRTMLGWNIFGQGTEDDNRMWVVSTRTDAYGLMIWGHWNDINSRVTKEFPKDEWHHLGVTWDGINYAFYYDGEVVASGAHGVPFDTRGDKAFYGARVSNPPGGDACYNGAKHHCSFKGDASDFKYFQRALSASEVLDCASRPRTSR